ncbi:nucleobase:cation symporter-2 family protein [Tissierella sp.]|uniref:uracil-xanthine permease family protein n=1 Tax=Tissierella sp. TaxID=41274 RepID=UPI00302E4243
MLEKRNKSKSISPFDINGVPPITKALPLSLQHILAMIVGTVTVPIIIAGVTGASPQEKTLLVQAALIVAGLATLLQIYPIGNLGSRLPIIFGVGFTYVPTLTAIGSEYGLSGIFGAQLVGGIFTILIGITIRKYIKYFPPLVTGTVVTTIGLSLYPIAINYMAGGINAPDYGSPSNWAMALLTLVVVIICSQFGKGYLKSASMIVGIAAGYIASLALNKVNFAPIAEAAFISIPKINNFSMSFHTPAIVSMLVLALVNALQTIGDLSATTMGGMNRKITEDELSRGIVGSGIVTAAGVLIGGLPPSSYSQNVGLLAMNKVISRFVIGIAGIFMLLAGFVPKFGALMTTIPTSVLGGATVSIFGMITMTGFKLIIQEELTARNVTIVGLALAMGMGVTTVPQCLDQFPEIISMIFGKSPIVIATMVAFILNIILPNKTLQDEENERIQMDAN